MRRAIMSVSVRRSGKENGSPSVKHAQRPAPIRIGRSAKILRHQPQLGIARRRVGQAVEQLGEGFHSASSSSQPTSASARPRLPIRPI